MRRHSHIFLRLIVLLAMGTWFRTGWAEPLKYAEEQMPNSLNPLFTDNMVGVRMLELVFDSLAIEDKYGRYEGNLASSWSIAPDKQSITFTLRNGVKWHDGKPFTADDVVFTVEAAKDPKTVFFQKAIFDFIKSATKEGADKVKIEFVAPIQEPLDRFRFKIMPKHRFANTQILATDPFANNPIGTGPFKVERVTGRQVRMQKHNYHRPLTVPGVFMQQIPDRNNQLELVQLGGLDSVILVRPRDVPQLERVRSVKLYPYPTVNWWYMAYNFKNPILAEQGVREAITHGLNRPELLQAHLGTGDILSGPFTQASPFYNWEVKARSFDPAKARQNLESLGWRKNGSYYHKGGKPLKLNLTVEKGGQEIRALCLDIASQMKEIGIELEVTFLDSAAFANTVFTRQKFDLALHSWTFRRFENLYPLFHSKGDRNFIGYYNPSVDSLLDRSRTARDSESLRRFYQGLHKTLHEDLPYTFMWSLNARTALSSRFDKVFITSHYYFTTIYEWGLRENK